VITVDTHTTLSGIEALRPDWQALWSTCDATPFQSPSWLLPWYRHLCFGQPLVVTIRHDGQLICLAPFVISEGVVYLAGTGVSDYLDVLFDENDSNAAWSALLQALRDIPGEVQRIDWQQLRADSPTLRLIRTPDEESDQNSAEVPEITPGELCPQLSFTKGGDWQIPEPFLKKLEYEERRLQRAGRIVMERGDAISFDRLFGALLRLHGTLWSARGHTGVLNDTAVQRFHEDAAHRLLAANMLRLYGLQIDGAVAACFYGFKHRSRTYYYLGGFDPAYARLSVGNQLVWHAIKQAAAEGETTFDFLRGREPYKYRWGAIDQPTYRWQLSELPAVCLSKSET
jgi:CelD/BcsL family acetyltransferase involved in cellulose biosynthesis